MKVLQKDYFEVRAFYLDGSKAFHTWNIGTMSRDMEIDAAKRRADIGLVEWREKSGRWQMAIEAPK